MSAQLQCKSCNGSRVAPALFGSGSRSFPCSHCGGTGFEPGVTAQTKPTEVKKKVSIWPLTVNVGLYGSAEDVRNDFVQRKIRIDSLGGTLLAGTNFSYGKEEVNFVRKSGANLGFQDQHSLRELLNRVQMRGYGLCTPQYPVAARAVFRGACRIMVAMEPMKVDGSAYMIYKLDWKNISRDELELVLSAEYSGGTYFPEEYWLLVDRK
jgi:hypothetical protein